MIIGTARVTIHMPWVHSLKEKRMVVKSICGKVHNQFNVAIAEVAEQDVHQLAVLGLACVANETGLADSILDHVLNFMEANVEGELTDVIREFR